MTNVGIAIINYYLSTAGKIEMGQASHIPG